MSVVEQTEPAKPQQDSSHEMKETDLYIQRQDKEEFVQKKNIQESSSVFLIVGVYTIRKCTCENSAIEGYGEQ